MLLTHLGLEPEAPTLDFLHRLVRQHQLRVPFETLTKLIDFEPGLARGDFLPALEEYVDRVVTRGAGGLCWTLARGFHELLTDLGFDAAYMVMEPGHCCLRVETPAGPHYADVGYAAPLFRAYPLFESFREPTHREEFSYDVRPEGIVVTRAPGPTKRLDPTPRALPQLHDAIVAANDWSKPQTFLRRLAFAGHVDGLYVSYRDGVLTRHGPHGAERTTVPTHEAAGVIGHVFGADPALFTQARAVYERHAGASPGA